MAIPLRSGVKPKSIRIDGKEVSSAVALPSGGFRTSPLGLGGANYNTIQGLSPQELAEQIGKFNSIAQSLTPEETVYLRALISEQNNRATRGTDDILEGTPSTQGIQSPAQPLAPISTEINPEDRAALENLFRGRISEATEELGRQFAPQRAKVVSEEAALGRLRSPVGALRTGGIDEAQTRALSSTIGQLLGQKSQAELGLGSELRGIGERGRELSARLGEGASERGLRELLSRRELRQRGLEFGQTQGLTREKMAQDLSESREGRALSERLGQAQAEASRPRQKGFLEEALPFLKIGADIGSKFIPTKTITSFA